MQAGKPMFHNTVLPMALCARATGTSCIRRAVTFLPAVPSFESCVYCCQVVGAFLEGGTPEETAAIKKVADERPSAPSDIDMLGLEFAAKL